MFRSSQRIFLATLLALACFTFPRAEIVRAHAPDTTGNRFVQAIVDDSTGYVWFLSNGKPLSKHHRSFLSLLVQNKSYSNMYPPPPPPDNDVAPDVWLFNGRTTKLNDTITTIWSDSGIDILQEVYPVAFEKSGQIVLRVKVVNHFGYNISAQAQYIIDGYVAGHDSALTLTNYGYSSDWQYYDNTESPFPLTYSSFENDLATADQGLDATGYLMDAVTPYPLGLRQPQVFMIGDMHAAHPSYIDSTGRSHPPAPPLSFLYQVFGYWDPSLQVGPCADNGYYMLWPEDSVQGVGADTVHELARTSFGTGEFEICRSADITTLTFFPHRLKYDVGHNGYIQNPFLIESLVFNPSATKVIPDFSMSQNVAGPIRIVQPQPTTKGGLSEVQSVPGLDKRGVWETQWLDSALHKDQTTSDSLSSIIINTSVGAGFTPGCDLVSTIEGARHDSIPPAMHLLSRSGSYDGSQCNTRCYSLFALDTGGTDPLKRGSAISGLASVALSPNSLNMHLVMTPFAGGPDTVPFSLCVTDSLFDASATVIVKDRAGNTITRDFEYCTIHDTIAPYVTWDTLGDGVHVRVRDDRPWDRGLAALDIIDSENCSIYWSSLIGFTPVYAFTVRHIDNAKPIKLTLSAKDEAGNWSSVFFYSAPAVMGVEGGAAYSAPLSIALFPNPTVGIMHVSLIGPAKASARLTDILGREVGAFEMSSETSYDMTKLPSGVYTLEVAAAGKTVSARVVRE